MRVVVCHSPGPRRVLEHSLNLPPGATVADALRVCGVEPAQDETVGVWGRRAQLSQPLREGDRVELVRPLQVDPKVARRERFRQQGSRAAGLFAGRRPGAKPGY